jgi:hypothetical protein
MSLLFRVALFFAMIVTCSAFVINHFNIGKGTSIQHCLLLVAEALIASPLHSSSKPNSAVFPSRAEENCEEKDGSTAQEEETLRYWQNDREHREMYNQNCRPAT